MNERIKELIEESYDLAEYNYAPPQKIFNKEKFAELIVRECATLGTNFTNRNYSDDAGERIAKHFGVEE
jgi:hypothetical protein